MRAATLARLTLVLLAAATFFAIFYAQELKREDPLLKYATPRVVRFQPVGPRQPHVSREAHFDLRTSVNDTLRVSIVSVASGRAVAVLPPAPMSAYRHRALAWNGRTARGVLAPVGAYMLAIRFVRAHQTVTPPMTLHLEGAA